VDPACFSNNNTAVANPGFPFNGAGLPSLDGVSWVDNAYELLTQAGQFYLDGAKGAIGKPLDAEEAEQLGLVTFAMDDIDWDDVRVFLEERASFSPDGLTGMEANLRFAGPETMETKIFARLTAWQNWIFQRPNAVGPTGALTLYGKPERPVFDFRRT